MLPPGLNLQPPGLTPKETVEATECTEMERQYLILTSTLAKIPDTAYVKETIPSTFKMSRREINWVNNWIKLKAEEAAAQPSAEASSASQLRQKLRFTGISSCIGELDRNFHASYYIEQCANARAQGTESFISYMIKQLSGKQERVQRRVKRLLETSKGQILLGDFIEEAANLPFIEHKVLIFNIKQILQPDSFAFPIILKMDVSMQTKWCDQMLVFMRPFFFEILDLSWILNIEETLFVEVILSPLNKIVLEMIMLSMQKAAPEAPVIHTRLMVALKALPEGQYTVLNTQKFFLNLLTRLTKDDSTEARKRARAIASLWIGKSVKLNSTYQFIETQELNDLANLILSK